VKATLALLAASSSRELLTKGAYTRTAEPPWKLLSLVILAWASCLKVPPGPRGGGSA